MNRQKFKNGHSMFPISTDALDFMQEQTLLVARLTELAGNNVIITQPTSGKPGLCVFDGELLPLTGNTSDPRIAITEIPESITAHGTTYENVRITRQAVYGTSGENVATFVVLDNMVTLKSAIANLTTALNTEATTRAKYDVPKGTIIDWYGTCKCDQIPYGWVPCGLFFKGNAGSFSGGNAGFIEIEKWKKKYSSITIGSATRDGSNFGIYISNCMGQSIPDLTDRFVVQAGFSYSIGETGGVKSVTLTAEQSGLPEHNHKVAVGPSTISSASACEKASENTSWGTFNTVNAGPKNASKSHENRPPYFALYKLIKVI